MVVAALAGRAAATVVARRKCTDGPLPARGEGAGLGSPRPTEGRVARAPVPATPSLARGVVASTVR